MTEEQPTRPRKLDRSIPRDLETIVLKATAREPGHRYATAGELAEDLRAFLADRPIRARRASAPERLRRWCRRNKMLAGLMAVAAASILVAFGAVTIGYITTTAALEKSQSNVKLSLAAFQRIFDEFTDPWDDGPFADGARDLRATRGTGQCLRDPPRTGRRLDRLRAATARPAAPGRWAR